MDRLFSRGPWMLVGILLLFTIVINTGCSIVATALWAVNPNDKVAAYQGLEKQRVAVVCRQVNDLDYRNSGVAKAIGVHVSQKLKDKVKEIEIVPQSEIDDWLDNNELVSFVEIGKALEADKVIAIDLERFSLFQGSTLLQGQATAQITVYDVAKDEEVFTRMPLETLYPQSTPLARADVSEVTFRRKFVEVLADQISRTFHAYDSREANANDVFYVE